MNLSWQHKRLQALARKKGELVLGYGNPNAEIMLIGEAPGREEVMAGQPFLGKAGKNLDEFLAATGLVREQLYLTNVVKFRPTRISPKGTVSNRPPTQEEIALCMPYLEEEIAQANPWLILTLGNVALQAMLGKEAKIGQYHGRATQRDAKRTVFALYHPASIIYNPKLKETYAEDLALLRAYLTKRDKSASIEELKREAEEWNEKR